MAKMARLEFTLINAAVLEVKSVDHQKRFCVPFSLS